MSKQLAVTGLRALGLGEQLSIFPISARSQPGSARVWACRASSEHRSEPRGHTEEYCRMHL